LSSIKSPILAVSLAELVANPEENGELSLNVQDLLKSEEIKDQTDFLTSIQITYLLALRLIIVQLNNLIL